MARNLGDFGVGREGGVDHQAEMLRIVGNDGLSPESKTELINNHPTLPEGLKLQAHAFIQQQSGGGIVRPAAVNPNFKEKPRAKVQDPDQISVTEDTPMTEDEVRARGASIINDYTRENPSAARPSTRTTQPTARTRGVIVNQTMSTPEFASNIQEIHAHLAGRANELNANMNATHPAHDALQRSGGTGTISLNYANDHLAQAKASIEDGKDYQFGRNGRARSAAVANGHYKNAFGHLLKAHEFLFGGDIAQATASTPLKSEPINPDRLSALKGHAKTLRIVKGGNSYNTYKMGDEQIEVGSERHDEIKARAKAQHDAAGGVGPLAAPYKKILLAERGTKRVSIVLQREADAADNRRQDEKPEEIVRDPRKKTERANIVDRVVNPSANLGATPRLELAPDGLPGVGTPAAGRGKPVRAEGFEEQPAGPLDEERNNRGGASKGGWDQGNVKPETIVMGPATPKTDVTKAPTKGRFAEGRDKAVQEQLTAGSDLKGRGKK